ncbi:MAG TPA: hypothetical protein VMW30_06895 [Candidatus Paceibacterota bacterium]|nr:hypothetical protein [Candidatus Paceibacterota bacterium]
MIRMSSTNYALVEHFAKDELTIRRMNAHVDKWTKEWNAIFQWAHSLAKELWSSVPEWADDRYIGVKAWEAKFPRSPEISEKMLLQFTGWKDMATLDKASIEQKSRLEAEKAQPIQAGQQDRRFYKIPEGISKMTDAEIDDWAANVYEKFVSATPSIVKEVQKGDEL